MTERDRRFAEDPRHLDLAVSLGGEKAAGLVKAGVVDEQIGAQTALGDPTGQLGPSVGIHQIAREHFGPNAVRGGELVSDLAELALPTCDKGHPVAA